ncbi:MAG TPA: GMC family oxidoreductase N-terminal domain-containing protein [Candidatus Dormibacteraeota bacterium]|nr:GMC family oxidoreductase N-terminal domain-containing protein [Candidatus Dormibacteraeota bacterium]
MTAADPLAGAARTAAHNLSARQRETLEALANTLLPAGVGAVPGAAELGLCDRVDAQLAGYDRATRGLIKVLISGFDALGVASRHLKPFRKMSSDERLRFLEELEDGRVAARRDLTVGLKALVQLAYFSTPEVEAAIGYDGLPLVAVVKEKESTRLPSIAYPDIQDGARDEADVVIVGTGAGGAVAAFELAEAGLSVILVEEGTTYAREDFDGVRLLDRLDHAYRDNGLTFTTGNVTISMPMGKAVGGTTVVNSGTCYRAPDWILDKWSKNMGVKDTDPATMEPYFAQVEEILNVTPVPDELMGNNGAVLRDGAAALGWKGGPIPRNIRGCHGSGQCAFGCPRDAKQAMHLSYLPMAVRRGARIYSSCRVERVRSDGVRATGVSVKILDSHGQSQGQMEIRARAVVVAAGAVYTPLLLAQSGLGGTSRQLGHNLRIHPGAGALALFDRDLHAWKGTMQSYAVDERLESDGIILEATMPPPGISYSAGALPFAGEKLVRHVAEYPRMAAVGMMVSDHSSGRVFRRPDGRPLMYYNMGANETYRMAQAVLMAGELYFAAGAKEYYPVVHGFPVLRSMDELRQLDPAKIKARDLKLSAYHPMGTARMGEDPRRAVVNSYGKSFACEGLYVCDASVLPSSTAVNPQLTIMATAHRIGRRLAADLVENRRG